MCWSGPGDPLDSAWRGSAERWERPLHPSKLCLMDFTALHGNRGTYLAALKHKPLFCSLPHSLFIFPFYVRV